MQQVVILCFPLVSHGQNGLGKGMLSWTSPTWRCPDSGTLVDPFASYPVAGARVELGQVGQDCHRTMASWQILPSPDNSQVLYTRLASQLVATATVHHAERTVATSWRWLSTRCRLYQPFADG